MDLWVVGAAAAAGYIAKQLKLSRERNSSLKSSSGDLEYEKTETLSCPMHQVTQRNKLGKDTNVNGAKFFNGSEDPRVLDSGSEAEAAPAGSFSGKLESSGNCNDCSRLSGSDSSSVFLLNDCLEEKDDRDVLNGDRDGKPHIGEVDLSCYSGGKRSYCITKRHYGHLIKPLTSLESCFMAQLSKERTRIEDYVHSTLPSPSSKVRPLIVTDGSQIISRANGDLFSTWIGVDTKRLHKEVGISGIHPLPKLGSLNLLKKATRRNDKFNSSGKGSIGKHSLLHNGSYDGVALFCTGVCIGVLSSVIANRREVDKLQDLLKQTENLVQDLQEELEMKDSLTVRELVNENSCSQDTCDNYSYNVVRSTNFPVQKVGNSTTNGGEASYSEKAEENSDSMSKIEAELEAELERLGLNMRASNMERRYSDLIELDPDYEPDFAQGELRAELVSSMTDALPESNQDLSSTSTSHSANYAVSPRELSLRLHEVIQSRLQEHVKELEIALENGHRKVQLMESEHRRAWRNLSRNELRYSSGEESPITNKDFISKDQLLVINLSGEALDAYNEAYEELTKPNESESDGSPYGIYDSIHQTSVNSLSPSMLLGRDEVNSSLLQLHPNSQLDRSLQQSPNVSRFLYDGTSEDERSDGNEEMEKQLIRQIVEKTKKGSPAVLNAQRVLLSMDDNKP